MTGGALVETPAAQMAKNQQLRATYDEPSLVETDG
jgi:hypothetical protein